MNGMTELARAIVGGGSAPRSSEHIATVIRHAKDGTYWVHIPGGADETPISSTMTEASEGDTVHVSISRGRAVMTGNMTSPSANVRTVTQVGGVANMALTTAYSESARIDNLQATMITADSAIITDIQADTAKVHNLTAEQLSASTAYVGALNAGSVSASDIIADHATIDSIDVEEITADHMMVNNLYADEESVKNLNANYAHIIDGMIDNAKIGTARIDKLDAEYAQVSLINVDDATIMDAWVDRIMVQTNLIAKNIVTEEETVYMLNALQVNADRITAGTLDIQRLIFTDPENPDNKYLVTWDENEQAFVQTYLDGGYIAENSIAADRIVAGSISTRELTTDNIGGTHGWINFSSGEFKFENLSEDEGISFIDGELNIKGSAIDMLAKASDVSALDNTVNGQDGLVDKVSDLQAHVRIEQRSVQGGTVPVIVLDAAGGQSNSGMSAELSNTALSFLDEGTMVAEVSNQKLTITDADINTAHVDESLSIGNFVWIPMADNSLSFKWIGGTV